jgi:hypothetical protein
MRRPTENVISPERSYDIRYLANVWESQGWQGLASLATALDIGTFGFGYKDDCNTHKVKHALEETYEWFFEEVDVHSYSVLSQMHRWCILVFATSEKKLPRSEQKQWDLIPDDRGHGGTAADDAKLLKCYGKIADALAVSKTLGDAFRNTVAPEMLNDYLNLKSLRGREDGTARAKFFRTRITNEYAEAFRNIARWTRKQASHQEVWWNCVWQHIRDDVEEMLRIQDHILQDVPLTDEQLRLINQYMNCGSPQGIVFKKEDGSCNYEICLDVQNCRSLPFRDTEIVGWGLLTQPAFALGQQYSRRWPQQQFIAKCRAPSCGKQFFTGRKNATACPGSQGGRKNECALEWVRYRNWLRKIGKRPEVDWDNRKLRKQFISYDSD